MRAALALAGLAALAPLAAQTAAPEGIAEVPPGLPSTMREPLRAERRLLESRVDGFNALVPDFGARCGPGRIPADAAALLAACESEFTRLSAEQRSIEAGKSAFRARVDSVAQRFAQGCATIDERLARDREALRRQQRVNESAVAELEEWARLNEEAQRSALLLGVKALFGEAANRLQARAARAGSLQAAIARHERSLAERGIPVEAARGRLATLARAYERASAQAAAGSALARAGEAEALYGFATTEAALITRAQSEADAELRRALEDPVFDAIIARDATALDLVRGTLDALVATPGFERLAPAYGLASFVVDYGYDATRWALSGRRILQGDALAGDALAAVSALTAQIRRTVEWQAACRAGAR